MSRLPVLKISAQRRWISDRSGIGDHSRHPFPYEGFRGIKSHQVNGGAEMHREIFFELKEGEEPDWPGKFDEDVDVARFGLLDRVWDRYSGLLALVYMDSTMTEPEVIGVLDRDT